MLDQLESQRDTLQSFLAAQRDLAHDGLSPGMRITLTIYSEILEDGVKILNTLIAYLARH
jgi:hypothetical protein